MASGGDTLNLRFAKSVSLSLRLVSTLIAGGLSRPSLALVPCATPTSPLSPVPLIVGGASFAAAVVVDLTVPSLFVEEDL